MEKDRQRKKPLRDEELDARRKGNKNYKKKFL